MRLLFEEALMKFINVNVICVPVSQKDRVTKGRSQVSGVVGDFCRLCLYEASSGVQPVQVLSKQHSLIRSANKMKTSMIFHFILAQDCIPPNSVRKSVDRPNTRSTYKQSSFDIRVEIQPLSKLLGSSVERVLQASV